jgi:hypothetical protein
LAAEVEKWAIGEGCFVRATLPAGTVDRIEGVATESDAGNWIKDGSVTSFHQRRVATE